MPLPEDESSWANLDVMFATTGGNVRRNKLSDFVDVRRSGIIAMKLDEDEAIVDVQICTEHDDVLLTAAGGQCIRFPVTDVRVFQGRTSMGVRGIALPKSDKLISLTILRHMDADAEERAAYLRRANAVRRGGVEEEAGTDSEDASGAIELGEQRYVEMSAHEQFVLTISGTDTASARRLNTGPPAGAAKASWRCRSTTATACWWRHSRSRTLTRSCW
jgi:DNA gyrase subunit A